MAEDNQDLDAEFSRLEQLAFRGQWDKAEKARVWNTLGLDRMFEQGIATNPAHDRLQHIMVVYGTVKEGNDPEAALQTDFGTIQRYVRKYPACIAHMPQELYKDVFPDECRAEEG